VATVTRAYSHLPCNRLTYMWTTVRDRINGGSAATHLRNVIAGKWDLNDKVGSLHKTTLTVQIYLRVSDQGMFSTVTSSTLEKVITML
jgi:hypothetical protein